MCGKGWLEDPEGGRRPRPRRSPARRDRHRVRGLPRRVGGGSRQEDGDRVVLDGKVKNPEPIAAAKLLLGIKASQFRADLVVAPQDGDPKGRSSRFVAAHDNFSRGTVGGEIDGKPYLGDFEGEEHRHDEKS